MPKNLGFDHLKIPGVIKGRFYMITSLSDSWEAFTLRHAGVTLGRFLHQLVHSLVPNLQSTLYTYTSWHILT